MTQSKTTKSATHWLPRSLLASALLVFGLFLVVPPATVEAQTAPAAYAAAKNDPVKLRNFLFRMPKGGDLHNHLTGSIYAESYLGWAAEDGKCWDILGQSISPGPPSQKMQKFKNKFCTRIKDIKLKPIEQKDIEKVLK